MRDQLNTLGGAAAASVCSGGPLTNARSRTCSAGREETLPRQDGLPLRRPRGHSSYGKRCFPEDKPRLTTPPDPSKLKGESSEGSGMVGMVCPECAESKNGGWEEQQEDKLVRNPAEGGVKWGERNTKGINRRGWFHLSLNNNNEWTLVCLAAPQSVINPPFRVCANLMNRLSPCFSCVISIDAVAVDLSWYGANIGGFYIQAWPAGVLSTAAQTRRRTLNPDRAGVAGESRTCGVFRLISGRSYCGSPWSGSDSVVAFVSVEEGQ